MFSVSAGTGEPQWGWPLKTTRCMRIHKLIVCTKPPPQLSPCTQSNTRPWHPPTLNQSAPTQEEPGGAATLRQAGSWTAESAWEIEGDSATMSRNFTSTMVMCSTCTCRGSLSTAQTPPEPPASARQGPRTPQPDSTRGMGI